MSGGRVRSGYVRLSCITALLHVFILFAFLNFILFLRVFTLLSG
jgi:hypothetical protein